MTLAMLSVPVGAEEEAAPQQAENEDITVITLLEDIYYTYGGAGNHYMSPSPFIEFRIKSGSYVDKVSLEIKTFDAEGWRTVTDDCFDMGSLYGHLFRDDDIPYSEKTIAENSVDGIGIYNNILRFRIEYDGGKTFYSDEIHVHWVSDERKFDRLYGANRYDTALAIAEELRMMEPDGKYANAVIACGTDFADALGGTYLATQYGAPILLVNKTDQVMQAVAGEIEKNLRGDGKVFILGGTGAVSAAMESVLTSHGISSDRIVRFAGRNRYDTNLQILQYCGVAKGDEIMICSGTGFADALSASAVGLPIVLVGRSFTEDQKAYLRSITGQTAADHAQWYVIGGPGAVSDAVGMELMIIREVQIPFKRLEGSNRYETSRAVSNEFFEHSMGGGTYCTSYHVALAYGKSFPDGLAGGVLANRLGAPLFLVDNNNWKLAGAHEVYYSPRHAYVLGGSALISDATTNNILNCTWNDLMN